MSDYNPPTMTQNDAPDPDWTLTFPHEGVIGQDNAWITVDKLWAVNIIRTDEGIVIDVYPNDESAGTEWVATLCVTEEDVRSDEDTPRCDVCNVTDEESDEWCGGCGCCVSHCQHFAECPQYAVMRETGIPPEQQA